MKPVIECSLLLSIITGLAYLFVPGLKKWSGRVFLAVLTVFVGVSLGSTPAHKSFKDVTAPALEVDQAEMSLKVLTAFRAAQEHSQAKNLHSAVSLIEYQGAPISHMLMSKIYGQVISSLEQRLQQEEQKHKAKDPQILAKIAIVCGDSGDASFRPKISQTTEQLISSGVTPQEDLGRALLNIYTKNFLPETEVSQYQKILKSNLRSGWYRNQALAHLFLVSRQLDAYNDLKTSIDNAALVFAQRTIVLLTVTSVAALTGIIAIIIFFATESADLKNAARTDSSMTPWSLTTTYGVLIGWIATQLVAQSILVAGAKPQLKHALQAGSGITAAVTAVIYLITTGPALVYIWWFACRPFGLRFVDAVRLRFNTARAGFLKLAVRGVLTWCAAMPVVLGCQLLSMRLFKSEGSSNPVLSLVRDAAHSPSIMPVTIYFIILGVLAPLVEEALFRGFVYSSLRTKLGRYTAAVVSAALFSTAHFDPGAFISLFALGFLFALVRERYQSIVPSMIAHGMWNCGTFILVLVLFGGS